MDSHLTKIYLPDPSLCVYLKNKQNQTTPTVPHQCQALSCNQLAATPLCQCTTVIKAASVLAGNLSTEGQSPYGLNPLQQPFY